MTHHPILSFYIKLAGCPQSRFSTGLRIFKYCPIMWTNPNFNITQWDKNTLHKPITLILSIICTWKHILIKITSTHCTCQHQNPTICGSWMHTSTHTSMAKLKNTESWTLTMPPQFYSMNNLRLSCSWILPFHLLGCSTSVCGRKKYFVLTCCLHLLQNIQNYTASHLRRPSAECYFSHLTCRTAITPKRSKVTVPFIKVLLQLCTRQLCAQSYGMHPYYQ